MRFIPYLMGALLFAIVARLVWRFWLGQHSKHWPRVLGKILVARIIRGSTNHEAGDNDEQFEIEVSYEYTVRGKAYVGQNYSFGQTQFADYGKAIDALDGITAGREVPVFYDPKRPQRSVLKRGSLL